jgi:predicted nucleic-acid-binding protein
VKITPDTNVLVRVVTQDDERQTGLAEAVLADAEIVAVTLPTLCELVWVLSRLYKIPMADIAEAIRRLMGSANVELNRPAVEAGLDMLDAGGDFADGVIAYEGRWLGGDNFVSFDAKAIKLLKASGETAKLLG